MSDPLGEFSNNLASDLGPLLALFGESMTIQYLSECTTTEDYIIFATAPIGIITALVSAIRICGGTYLRAFIGRAREGAAAAEVELCTSTGRDVCELFTRGGITRSLGKPSILELVYLQPEPRSSSSVHGPENLQIYRKYLKSHRDGRWPKKAGETKTRQHKGLGYWVNKAQSHLKDPEEADLLKREEKEATEPEPDTDLPNLSLNVGIVKPPRYVFWIVATIGVTLQTGVLVLAALDPAGFLEKEASAEEDTTPDSALVRDSLLFIIGTVLMCLGMGACAALIGRTTREFVDTKREPERERLLWLQPGNQKIGDQSFGCYAIFETRRRPVARYMISTMDDRRREKMHVHTTVAAATTLVGFIAQFIGIRGLNAWVSLAQLIITIVMSLLRGMVRMQRRGKEDNELKPYDDKAHGHELDWLAFNLACDDCSNHRYSQDSGDSASEPQLHRGYSFQVTGKTPVLPPAEKKACDAEITGSSENHREAEDENGAGRQPETSVSETRASGVSPEDCNLGLTKSSQQCHAAPDPKAVFEMRVKLANLTGNTSLLALQKGLIPGSQTWESQLVSCREKAYQISTAVCDAAAVLFPDASQRKSLQLQVGISKLEVDASAHQTVTIHLQAPQGTTSTAWAIDTDAIEALLSLWVWSIMEPMSRTPPESHRATGSGEVKNFFHVAARIVSTGDGDVHWGRRTYVETELRMLLGSDMPTLKTTSVRIDPQSEYGIVNMWPLNDDGDKAAGGLWQQTPPPGASSSRGRRVFGWQRADSSARERGSVNRTYTVHYVDVMTSIVEICAQEIYTALIAPISSSADFAGLDVALSGKGADRRLVGDRFAAVRNSFVDLELGTTSDAVLCLLSAFRDKLRITHTQEDVLEIVMECLSTTDWKAMEQFLRWAVVAFEADDLKRIIRATAEFYRRAMVHQRQLDFCAEGIRWLASKVPSSFLSEDGIIRGYEAVIQRVRENGFPEYAPEELLRAIGLEYKSGAEETDDVNGLTVEGHGGKGHFDIIVNETGGRSDSMVTALYLLCGTPILLPEDPEQRDDVIARLYPDVLPWAAKHFEADLVTYAFGMSSNNAEDNPGTLWSSVVLAITSMFSTPLFRSFSNHSVFRDAMNGRHCLLYSPIINAVELGDYDLAYLLGRLGSYSELEHGFRIGVASAAFRDDLRMVHHLIPNGTTEEKEVFAYQRLLFRSAWDGSLIGLKSAVAGLRRRNAKIDHKGENGQTALSIAARMGDVAGVEYLLSLGEDVVDPCTQDDMRWTPLSWALKEYPLAYATKLQDYEAVVRSLLNVQTSWNDDRFLAADSEGRTPISLAALTGSEELLMSVCMNFEYKEEHLMDSNHRTPLSLAANLGFAKIVRRLLDTHGCKPNIPDLQGQTALHLAAACDRGAETVEALLEHRSLNPNAQDLDGRTPLLVAAQHRHTRSVRALLKRKDVKIGIPDHSGRTPLSYAAESRSTATVAALVERCSEKDLNAEDLGGWTPLCWAIYRPRLKVINLLVRDRRVRVPHPALEDEHGSKLVDVAVQSAREFLLKLGVWRMWEDGDGNQHWDKVENPEIAPPEGLAEYLKEGTDDEEEFYVGEEGVDIDPQEASQLEGSIGSERREEGSDIGDMDDTGAEEKNTGPEKEASDGPGQQLSDEREADGEEKMTGLANKTANGPDQ